MLLHIVRLDSLRNRTFLKRLEGSESDEVVTISNEYFVHVLQGTAGDVDSWLRSTVFLQKGRHCGRMCGAGDGVVGPSARGHCP